MLSLPKNITQLPDQKILGKRKTRPAVNAYVAEDFRREIKTKKYGDQRSRGVRYQQCR